MTRSAALLGSLLVLAPALRAEAAGYYVSDVGTRGMARGGAFVAAPDSLLALAYNPAALSLLRGFHVEADIDLVSLGYTFKRTCPCVDPARPDAAELDAMLSAGFTPVENMKAPMPVPFVGFGYGFDFWHLTIAAGGFGFPSQAGTKYGEVGAAAFRLPSRYTNVDSEFFEAFYALGVAAEPIEGLRLGFSGSLVDFRAQLSQHLWANSRTFASVPEDSEFDLQVALKFAQGPLIGWAFGASWSPTFVKGLSIGASFLGVRSVRADGSGTLTPKAGSAVADLVEINGDPTFQLETQLAPVFRAGIQYEVEEWGKAEVAVGVQGWGIVKDIKIRPISIDVKLNGQPVAIETVRLERNWKHAPSVRFGGELTRFWPYIGVRAGGYWESSAVDGAYVDASAPDFDKIGFGGGLATQWYGITLELAAQAVILSSLEQRESARRNVGVLPPPSGSDDLLTNIGNGDHSGSFSIFSASLSYSLDAFLN